ncbi:hypothetical protein H7K09_26285 [Mycolicibacterium duvalii]|nr:hypothetical protein [Mycolicibacterium duvalii]MCV7370954.1 hypothetical protein [Mycolicibacterium duvalii]
MHAGDHGVEQVGFGVADGDLRVPLVAFEHHEQRTAKTAGAHQLDGLSVVTGPPRQHAPGHEAERVITSVTICQTVT